MRRPALKSRRLEPRPALGWTLLGLLLLSAQVDLALQVGPLTIFHNELLLALVVLSLPWVLGAQEKLGRILLWALPLMLWMLAHGLSPGPLGEGVKAVLRAAQPLLGLALPWLLLRDDEDWKRCAWLALAALSFSAAWGISQTVLGPGHALNLGREAENIGGVQAAAAGMGHHNQWGAALVPGLGLALVLALEGPWRKLALGAMAFLALGLACSFSRGAWLAAMVLALSLLPVLSRRTRWGLGAVALVLVLVALLGPWPAVRERLGSLGQDSDRTLLWRGLWPYVSLRWAWGWGWPQVTWLAQATAQTLNRDAWATRALSVHAHNSYLQYALAFGVPVLALGLAAILPFLRIGVRAARSSATRVYGLAFLGAMAGLALQAGTDLLTIHTRGLLPALLCGMILARAQFGAHDGQALARPGRKSVKR